MDTQHAVVYTIRGPDGVYVGETVNPKLRWCSHKVPSKRVGDNLRPLYESMRRHGIKQFTFEIVATCTTPLDPERSGHSREAVELESEILHQMVLQGENVLNNIDVMRQRFLASVILRRVTKADSRAFK